VGGLDPDQIVIQGIEQLQEKLALVIKELQGTSGGADGMDLGGAQSPTMNGAGYGGADGGGYTTPGYGGASAWGGAGGAAQGGTTPYGATPYGNSW
jgi:DNA-directed RNA polymerase II subunit RPB3